MGPWCNGTRCGMGLPQPGFNSKRVPNTIPRDIGQVNFTIALDQQYAIEEVSVTSIIALDNDFIFGNLTNTHSYNRSCRQIVYIYNIYSTIHNRYIVCIGLQGYKKYKRRYYLHNIMSAYMKKHPLFTDVNRVQKSAGQVGYHMERIQENLVGNFIICPSFCFFV